MQGVDDGASVASAQAMRDAHASASDFLSVSPVLEKYVNDVCKDCGIDVNITECILALSVVFALLQRAKLGNPPAPRVAPGVQAARDVEAEDALRPSPRPKHAVARDLAQLLRS